jgi:hypothetical protein
MDNKVNVPSNNKYLESRKARPQSDIETAFNDFKVLLADKTHPDNQTQAYHNNVVSTLNRLLTAADKLDENNPGEGIFGLIILSLRSSLKLKDEFIRQDFEIKELKREINRLKKNQAAKE